MLQVRGPLASSWNVARYTLHCSGSEGYLVCVFFCLLADASSIPHIPPGTYAVLVSGTMKASKGRDAQEQANNILVLLAVLRFPQHATDLLVTVNAPLFVAEGSSAGVEAGVQPAAQEEAVEVMQGVLRSLAVRDWGLFGG